MPVDQYIEEALLTAWEYNKLNELHNNIKGFSPAPCRSTRYPLRCWVSSSTEAPSYGRRISGQKRALPPVFRQQRRASRGQGHGPIPRPVADRAMQ